MGDCSFEEIQATCYDLHVAVPNLKLAPTIANATTAECDLGEADEWRCMNSEEQHALAAIYDTRSPSTPVAAQTSSERAEIGLQVSFVDPLGFKFQKDDGGMVITATLRYRVRAAQPTPRWQMRAPVRAGARLCSPLSARAAPCLPLQMQWSDPRLATAPCRRSLSYYMAIDSSHSPDEKAQAAFVRGLQWTPKISINGANSSVVAASFLFNESLAWLDSDDPLPRQHDQSSCENCGVYMATEVFEIKLAEAQFGSYIYFPFDYHTVRIQISVQDTARFYSCEQALRNAKSGWASFGAQMMARDWQSVLMPSTNDWTLGGSARAIGFRAMDESPNSCELVLEVARNPLVFLIKQILTTIFFVLCGLLALTLAPTDLMGDRVTTILFSALIVTTNMQGDIGLGSPQYIIW
jgi:hypothetical protein